MNNTTQNLFMRSSSRFITREAEIYIYMVTLVIGLIGNGLVLCSIATRRRRRLTANDIFILNLALSDLLLLVVFLPFSIYIRWAVFRPNLFICKFTAPIITVALGATIFTLTVMAMHRCSVITQPFRQEMTIKMASVTVLCVWILSLALSIPKIVNARPLGKKCLVDWKYPFQMKAYTVGLFVVRFAIPFIVIILSYVKMGIALLGRQSPRFTTDASGNIRNVTNRRENIAVVKTLLLISGLFLVCMLPYRVSLLMIIYGTKGNNTVLNIYSTSAILTIAHSCINPIIYGAILRQFTNDYKRLVSNILCCKICRKQSLGRNAKRSDGIELREDDGVNSYEWKTKDDVKTIQDSLLTNDDRQKGENDASQRMIQN